MGMSMGTKEKDRKGTENKKRGERREGEERKEKKRWVVCDGVVGAGTGNVPEKYFQSFVICFLYEAYGLH